LRRRVEFLSEGKALYQMTCAVEDVGEAPARPGYIVELCAVLEGIDRNAASVDLRDPNVEYPSGASGSLCARSTARSNAESEFTTFAPIAKSGATDADPIRKASIEVI